MAVPLVNVGPFGSPFGTDLLSQIRTYRLQLIRGNIDDPTSINPVTRVGTGATRFDMPFDNIGSNSIPDGYAAYANQFIHDIGIPGCDDGKVFVGQRKEPFVVNLGEVFDLINLNPLGNPDAEASDTKDKNITSLILEVPTDCLTEGGSGIIGGWTTARLPRNRTLTDNPTYDDPDQQTGDLVQVSRLANPLVNEVAIGLPDKNLFNAAHPRDDGANFLCPASAGNGEQRSAGKLTEGTHEESTETLHSRREGRHPETASAGQGAGINTLRRAGAAADGVLPLAEGVL